MRQRIDNETTTLASNFGISIAYGIHYAVDVFAECKVCKLNVNPSFRPNCALEIFLLSCLLTYLRLSVWSHFFIWQKYVVLL